MKGKRAYIDTNVLVYVALKHPDFYDDCLNILKMLVDGDYIGYGSLFVLFELFGALSKINPKAAYEASTYYLNLPIKLLEFNRDVLELSYEISRISRVTYDSLHAALMFYNDIGIIITEDLDDWIKIKEAWKKLIRRRIRKNKELIILSPTKGVF